MSATGLPKLKSSLYQALVEFPSSALTTSRQRDPAAEPGAISDESKAKIDDSLYQLCQSPDSVSSLVAQFPTLTPGEAWEKLCSRDTTSSPEVSIDVKDLGKGNVGTNELQRAQACGKWGQTQPSELFLRLYHDSLCTLNDNPALGVVSPSLLGSSGVVPLTIISVIPDIVRHMSNLIVRADREVFLATNFWQNSVASKFITDAMKELSRRAGERGTRIVMKVMYDRGSVKQLLDPHYFVPEKEYTGKGVGLPAKREIPNIDLEVMNYHDPMLGTFHSKFMIVDRKIGIVQSNNIQDNDNLEMMVHVEGSIVDGLYDMALLSWHKAMNPPLPSINFPASKGGIGSFTSDHDKILTPEGTLKGHSVVMHPKMIPERVAYGPQADQKPTASAGPSTTEGTVPGIGNEEQDAASNKTATTEGIQSLQNTDTTVKETNSYLDGGHQAMAQAHISAPSPQNDLLPEHTIDDPHYDRNIAGEVARVQTAVSTKPEETRMEAITRHLNHTINEGYKGTAPECNPQDEMTPYIPQPIHNPFPIALVNRAPYAPPNHDSSSNPQNAAWLSALRNAKKNVFIQSPTLNAKLLVPAIIEACERGVDVYCYICLGYNDVGELLPMQGGHNEMIANLLYTTLSSAARQHLHWFWYVGKDQDRPLVAESRRRSCHIKLMIVDEIIGIVGSGNQDTQSWFHSQEVNIMLESRDVCKAWIDGLRRNQNTHKYGAVGREDGVWRDASGNQAEGVMGIAPGAFGWAKGVLGAAKLGLYVSGMSK